MAPRRYAMPSRARSGPASAAAAILDLGSGSGAEPACTVADRHGRAGLLLRPAQPLAAWDEREHQWAAAAVLPEGHGPERPQRGNPCRGGGNAQQPAAQDAWVANAGRGL